MEPNVPMFHAREGLHFGRLADGSVLVWFKTSDLPNGAGPRIVLDPGTWASVVASVTPTGDDADTFREAQRLHLNGAPKLNFDPRTALGPEHMETLGKMADDAQKARDAHLNDPLA